MNKVDGIDVSFDGMFNTLVIRNQDENGAVAAVTSVLNQLRINVANMSLCRHKRGGDALMVIETDQHIKPHQVSFLAELPGILSVTYTMIRRTRIMSLDSMADILHCMEQEGKEFWEVVLAADMEERQVSRESSLAKMLTTWQAMVDASDSYTGDRRSVSGLVGATV